MQNTTKGSVQSLQELDEKFKVIEEEKPFFNEAN
uniref:Uncharacterized protein n=1 Tax=Rhizophora mucronata TaxID=61149 RepID=A0A2P2ISH5_RHIMU